MRRRRRSTDDDSHPERWIVSYADFITLLFAFFIVMYAISTLNENKYRAVGNALGFAFNQPRGPTAAGPTTIVTMLPHPMPKPPRADDPARVAREQKLSGVAAKLTDALAPLVETGHVRLKKTPAGLVVEIDASVLFAPAQAALQPGSIAALTAAAKVVGEVENALQVEGHTDSQPIASTAYPSNWELASARAASVVRLFEANGVDPKRMLAVGYADNRPVDTNDTATGRANNRRVTLLILSDPGLAYEVTPAVADPVAAVPDAETAVRRPEISATTRR